jgi:hypothetical protein
LGLEGPGLLKSILEIGCGIADWIGKAWKYFPCFRFCVCGLEVLVVVSGS